MSPRMQSRTDRFFTLCSNSAWRYWGDALLPSAEQSYENATVARAIGRILEERVQRQLSGVTGLVAPSIHELRQLGRAGRDAAVPWGKDLRPVTVCRRRGWLRRNEPGQASASVSS